MTTDKQIISLKNTGDILSCGIPITKEEWLNILRDKTITSTNIMNVLLSFYFMQKHKASCLQCANKYGYSPNFYNSNITNFGKKISAVFKDFEILDENGTQIFWPYVIGKGRYITEAGNTQFEYCLRRELVEAVEEIIIENAITDYLNDFKDYWENEKYKWRAIKWFKNYWDLNAPDFPGMLDNATSKSENLLGSRNSFPRAMIVEMAKADANAVRNMFATLYDETKPLEYRVSNFIKRSEEIRRKYNRGNWNMHYQSTNSISIYLWLRYPDRYYIYKYGEIKEVAEKLGLDYSFKRNGDPYEMTKGYKMYGVLNYYLVTNKKAKEIISDFLSKDPTLYPDPQLITATNDLGYYISRRYKSLQSTLYSTDNSFMNPFISNAKSILENKKNIILQGAPGTGKTYNTAALALAIIDGKVPDNHDQIMARYTQLCDEKRIGFSTFHQSMDYEDFIEGIKPFHESDNISYKIKDGIFKEMCISAKTASEVAASGAENILTEMNDNPTIWKVSLDSTGDNPIRRDCMENGHIRIGWEQYGDIDFLENNSTVTEGKYILRTFQNDMKVGDIVVSCWSANETDAIGIITGDYEYRPEGGQRPRYRDVHWIVKGIRHDITAINNNKRMTLGTVYRLSISLNDIIDIIKQYAPTQNPVVDIAEKPYVLIIDEINRGNISKVFGELITLIEKDKRMGAEHPLTVTLPYSQKPFGVPSNLYIVGTMNSTDRSTGTIDYALRRRFSFLTVPSEKEHIKNKIGKNLFDSVKEFIEKFRFIDMEIDDLMVGHSYFMAEDDEDLRLRVKYEIIPLIKEYIKDGILRVNLSEQKKYFDAWLELNLPNDNNSGTSAVRSE